MVLPVITTNPEFPGPTMSSWYDSAPAQAGAPRRVSEASSELSHAGHKHRLDISNPPVFRTRRHSRRTGSRSLVSEGCIPPKCRPGRPSKHGRHPLPLLEPAEKRVSCASVREHRKRDQPRSEEPCCPVRYSTVAPVPHPTSSSRAQGGKAHSESARPVSATPPGRMTLSLAPPAAIRS